MKKKKEENVNRLIYLALSYQLRLNNKEGKILKENINYSTCVGDFPVSP